MATNNQILMSSQEMFPIMEQDAEIEDDLTRSEDQKKSADKSIDHYLDHRVVHDLDGQSSTFISKHNVTDNFNLTPSSASADIPPPLCQPSLNPSDDTIGKQDEKSLNG